jgi:hypothetical protein
MNTRRIMIIVLALLVALASLACLTSPTATPAALSTPAQAAPPLTRYDGAWSATAATGDIIVITVKNGVVTRVEIDVTVYGEGWQAQSKRTHPVSAPIIDNNFVVDVRDGDWVTHVVGSFQDNVLQGSLGAAHQHPQGYGTALAVGVNFTATRRASGVEL